MDFQKWSKFSLLLVSSIMYLKPDPLYAQKAYYVQAGSYLSEKTALTNLNTIENKSQLSGSVHHQIVRGKEYYQIWLGPYREFHEAKAAEYQIHQIGRASFIRTSSFSAQKEDNLSERIIAKKNKIQPKARGNTSFNATNRKAEPRKSFVNLIPRAYRSRGILNGTLATKTNFGEAEFLQPVWSLSNGFAYVDAGGKYGNDDAWYAGGGAGIRTVYHDAAVVGGYVFADYNRSNRNKDFWIVNPGLEYMNANWDGIVNAYIPVSSQQKSFGIVPGFRVGIDSTHFGNHSIFEDEYNILDVTGPGMDGEIGYTFNALNNARAFIGSYYFNPKFASDFIGVEGGMELPFLERFTVVIHDAYDRVQGNTFMGTLRVTLDGNQRSTPVHNRLFDPIRRHLGAQQTGSGVPILEVNKFVEQRVLDTNAWFFSLNGTPFNATKGFANCTFEHPCNVFGQDAITGINGISPNASLLLNSGTYNNPTVGTGLTLYSGQNVSGRMNNFKAAAYGTNRPLINDTLLLPGSNNLANVQINANTNLLGALTGVFLQPGVNGSVNINNSRIVSQVEGAGVNARGIVTANNGLALNISESEINSSIANDALYNAIGILSENSGLVSIDSSQINAISTNSNGAVGFQVHTSTVGIKNSFINVYANAGQAYALGGYEGSPITIFNSVLNLTAENSPANTSEIYVAISNDSMLNIINSTLNMNVNNYGRAAVMPINTGSGGQTNMYGSIMNLSAVDSGSYVAGLNIGNGAIKVASSNINLYLNNTGTTSFNYVINGSSNSSIYLDKVNIKALGRNMPSFIQGIYHGGPLTYKDITEFIVNSPTAAYAYGGPGPVTALSTNSMCIAISPSLGMVVGCPPATA